MGIPQADRACNIANPGPAPLRLSPVFLRRDCYRHSAAQSRISWQDPSDRLAERGNWGEKRRRGVRVGRKPGHTPSLGSLGADAALSGLGVCGDCCVGPRVRAPGRAASDSAPRGRAGRSASRHGWASRAASGLPAVLAAAPGRRQNPHAVLVR